MFAAYREGLSDLPEGDVVEACRRWPRIPQRGRWWPALEELRELVGDIAAERHRESERMMLADPAVVDDLNRWPVELYWLQRRLVVDGGQADGVERVKALARSVGVQAVTQACVEVDWARNQTLTAAQKVFAKFGWRAAPGEPSLRVVA